MNILRAVTIGACVAAAALVCAQASAQAPSLQEQLNAQYKLAKVGRAGGAWNVLEPGTVLEIQKTGLLGVPPASVALCPSKFEGGNLKSPGVMCTGMLGKNVRYLTVGEKVYPAKLEVNLGKDKIVIAIFECDSCNGVSDPASYRSEVVFQFPKGSLASTSVGQVEDTIGQVLAIGNGEPAQDQNAAQSGAPASAPAQAEPQTIRMGQTTDEVVTAIGKPEKIVDLGSKQIYFYKDMKVTFVGGKVSDVQ